MKSIDQYIQSKLKQIKIQNEQWINWHILMYMVDLKTMLRKFDFQLSIKINHFAAFIPNKNELFCVAFNKLKYNV